MQPGFIQPHRSRANALPHLLGLVVAACLLLLLVTRSDLRNAASTSTPSTPTPIPISEPRLSSSPDVRQDLMQSLEQAADDVFGQKPIAADPMHWAPLNSEQGPTTLVNIVETFQGSVLLEQTSPPRAWVTLPGQHLAALRAALGQPANNLDPLFAADAKVTVEISPP